MAELDPALDAYWALVRAVRPGPLDALHVHINPDVPIAGGGPMDVTFILQPAAPHETRRFIVACQDVREFRFACSSNMPWVELDIYPIAEYERRHGPCPYPEMRYRVAEVEQDNDIAFYCARFQCTLE